MSDFRIDFKGEMVIEAENLEEAVEKFRSKERNSGFSAGIEKIDKLEKEGGSW